MPLRIGFDAIRALHNTTGLGNYARGVLRGLHALDPSLELHLYSPKAPATAFRNFPREISATVHLPSPTSHVPSPLSWRTFRLGRAAARDGIRLYHGLTHEIPRDLPRTSIRSVVSFADIIFESHPKFFPFLDRASYRWRYRWSAQHADAIVAISEYTRNELVNRYRIEAARIHVVPPARDPRFSHVVPAGDQAAVRARYDLPSEFLLSVGTLEPRKNQGVLVSALAQLHGRDVPPLVLVGRDGGALAFLEEMLRHLKLRDRVLIRTDVTTSDLPALMQSATLFLYPSVVEGFGMPIVEALSGGTPVIASSGGCLTEAGGPGSRYVPPSDTAGWAAAIAELSANSAVRDGMRTAGFGFADQFDDAKVAARLLGVYDAVMAEQSSS